MRTITKLFLIFLVPFCIYGGNGGSVKSKSVLLTSNKNNPLKGFNTLQTNLNRNLKIELNNKN